MLCGIPKKVIQRYFYYSRVSLTYKDIGRLISLCNDPNYDLTKFPKRYTADTLIRIKRALEDCRRNEGLISRAGAEAESNLLEVAADMGNNTAIALLCGARMRQKNASSEDMESGSELLTKLMDVRFPLAFKVSADLAISMGRPKEALQFYQKALDEGLEDNKLVVECLRNIAYLLFQQQDLLRSRDFFNRACMLAEEPKQVADCHFMLAQLREPDRPAMRQHLELAATHGFHNAFMPLGTILLNWFNEPRLAREWFKLAIATDTTGAALVGLLDAASILEDWPLAKSTLAKIRLRQDAATLLATRKSTVTTIEAKGGEVVSPQSIPNRQPQRSGRFDF